MLYRGGFNTSRTRMAVIVEEFLKDSYKRRQDEKSNFQRKNIKTMLARKSILQKRTEKILVKRQLYAKHFDRLDIYVARFGCDTDIRPDDKRDNRFVRRRRRDEPAEDYVRNGSRHSDVVIREQFHIRALDFTRRKNPLDYQIPAYKTENGIFSQVGVTLRHNRAVHAFCLDSIIGSAPFVAFIRNNMRTRGSRVRTSLRQKRGNNQPRVPERKVDERNDSGKARLIRIVFHARRNNIYDYTVRTLYFYSEIRFTRNILSDNTCDKRTSYDTERTLFIDESRGGTE